MAAATLGGAALGVANSLTLIATQAVIRPERAGEASGVTKTAVTVAAGLGVGLAGAVTDRGHGVGAQTAADSALLITASGCTAGCVVLAVWIRLRAGAMRTPSGDRGYDFIARTGLSGVFARLPHSAAFTSAVRQE
ncbi:hypothetical protein [Streptomyces silvensis]|uniref:hypothetical protein n=1 Tax=Streptomyces silvensis TaxID=1765722 RepID=UPI001F518845|nr:hypothetical protein [Streptomyces silvensis]